MAAKKKVKRTHCPGGHTLPNPGCSPVACVEKGAVALDKVKKEPLDNKLEFAIARKEAREALVPVPDLKGADAEEHVESRSVNLMPRALAEMEYQLNYGDNTERINAARDIMRMNGRLNRDAPTGVGPTIIINTSNGEMQLPWLPRKEEKPSAKVIEAENRGGKKE